MATKMRDAVILRAEREEYYDMTTLTLDGEPAHILSTKSDFAIVVRTDGKGGRVEYSWHAVRSVVANRAGAFRS